MPSKAVSLDTVMIKIESESGKAGANIDSLANKLQNLRNSIKGGFNNLNKLSESLGKLTSSTQGLDATINNLKHLGDITDGLVQLSEIKSSRGLTTVVNQLNNLNKTSKNLDKTSNNLSAIGNMIPNLGSLSTIKAPTGLTSVVKNLTGLAQIKGMDSVISEIQKVPQLVEPLSKLGDIVNPKGFRTAVDNLEKLPDVISKFDTTTFENLKRVSEELAQSLTPLAEKMMEVANGYSAFSKIQNTFGKSASTSYKYMKQQNSILSSLSSVVKRTGSYFMQVGKHITSAFGSGAISYLKKFHSKSKQIFLSLLGTRTLFTMIRKAASEYQAFDTSLQKTSQNIWRAFGAQLAPIIEYVMNLFKQFVRVVYSVVYALTGIDLIAKANDKAMKAWEESTKKTLGSLQKFDDLNVVDFDKNKGDEFEPIEMDKIDLTPIQKIIDWVKKLKEEIKKALDTGEWYNVGKVFAEGINEGVSWLLSKIPEIREKLLEAARDFGDFLNGVIENTNWGNIAKLITESLIIIPDTITELLKTIRWDEVGKGIDDFLKKLDPVKIIDSFMNMIGELAVGVSEAFINIEWGPVGKKISDSIIAFFTDLSSILDKIPFEQIGQKVREAIENIDWKGVFVSILNTFVSVFSGLGDFIDGLFGTDGLGNLLLGAGALLGVFKQIGGLSLFSKIGDISKSFISASKNAKSLYDKVKLTFDLLGKNILTTKSISGITGLSEGFTGAATSVSGLVSALGGLGPTIAIMGAVVAAIAVIGVAFKELYTTNTEFKNTVDSLGESISNTFGGIMQTAKDMISGLLKVLKDLWKNVLTPLFDLLVEIAKPIVEVLIDVLKILWEDVIDPLISLIEEGLMFAWDQLCITFEATTAVLNPVIKILTWLWKNVLSPIVSFILDVAIVTIKIFAEKVKFHINVIKGVISVLHGFLKTTWDVIKKVVGGIASWIYTNMISPVVDKFNELKKKISDIWGGIWTAIKKIINKILKGVEDFINGIIKGINGLSKGLRKIGNKVFDIIGIDVTFNPISEIGIPKLATGTNEIEYEGIYHLHPGEAVVPKKYNPALGNGYTNSNEMNNKLDTLIDIMNNMSFTNVVNVGNKKLYEEQQSFNKKQQNKYGTINLY